MDSRLQNHAHARMETATRAVDTVGAPAIGTAHVNRVVEPKAMPGVFSSSDETLVVHRMTKAVGAVAVGAAVAVVVERLSVKTEPLVRCCTLHMCFPPRADLFLSALVRDVNLVTGANHVGGGRGGRGRGNDGRGSGRGRGRGHGTAPTGRGDNISQAMQVNPATDPVVGKPPAAVSNSKTETASAGRQQPKPIVKPLGNVKAAGKPAPVVAASKPATATRSWADLTRPQPKPEPPKVTDAPKAQNAGKGDSKGSSAAPGNGSVKSGGKHGGGKQRDSNRSNRQGGGSGATGPAPGTSAATVAVPSQSQSAAQSNMVSSAPGGGRGDGSKGVSPANASAAAPSAQASASGRKGTHMRVCRFVHVTCVSHVCHMRAHLTMYCVTVCICLCSLWPPNPCRIRPL